MHLYPYFSAPELDYLEGNLIDISVQSKLVAKGVWNYTHIETVLVTSKMPISLYKSANKNEMTVLINEARNCNILDSAYISLVARKLLMSIAIILTHYQKKSFLFLTQKYSYLVVEK